jgi:pilus assembly protein Flp/PilA
MHAFLHRIKQDERGITAIEYAALAVGLAGLISMLAGEDGEIGKALKAAFEQVTTKLTQK